MSHLAPERFVKWMTNNRHVDRRFGHVYRYHSRSDSHSKALCVFVLIDLLAACRLLREHANCGKVVYGVNLKYLWARSGKAKTIDLAIGLPACGVGELTLEEPIAEGGPLRRGRGGADVGEPADERTIGGGGAERYLGRTSW